MVLNNAAERWRGARKRAVPSLPVPASGPAGHRSVAALRLRRLAQNVVFVCRRFAGVGDEHAVIAVPRIGVPVITPTFGRLGWRPLTARRAHGLGPKRPAHARTSEAEATDWWTEAGAQCASSSPCTYTRARVVPGEHPVSLAPCLPRARPTQQITAPLRRGRLPSQSSQRERQGCRAAPRRQQREGRGRGPTTPLPRLAAIEVPRPGLSRPPRSLLAARTLRLPPVRTALVRRTHTHSVHAAACRRPR